ncbi:PaaI family thioesterase [Nocardia asteroides]|uniref:PaaI family thioesterase n=1 Tax=Nocardia asteroides TaxID=1824 RepID=UPI001E532099|nr:PaaI family thioesterase [Nocardia asteroides]UGT64629.1 PaaI family thioesterase [Nocardia asteroides]
MSEKIEPVIDLSAIDPERYEQHARFFPKVSREPIGPSFGPFVDALRRVQDLAVSVDAPDGVYAEAAALAERLAALLEPHRAPELQGPAGRAVELPGRGSLLLLPWQTAEAGPDGVAMTGVFRRFHLGGNGAAHGGVLPLLFDELFGSVLHYAGRPISRTGYLHVNYRKVTPLERTLAVRGRVDRVEGRKTFVTAELRDDQGELLADAEGLMIQLLPGQP